MATWIAFSGESKDGLRVSESPSEVQEAFNAGHGGPFQVTLDIGGTVFVNPARVAFWREGAEYGGRAQFA